MKKLLISVILTAITLPSFAQSEADRELQRVIKSVGEPCNQVIRVVRGKSVSGSKLTFGVMCSGNQSYLVTANQNGAGSVLSCKIMEKINLRCFDHLN